MLRELIFEPGGVLCIYEGSCGVHEILDAMTRYLRHSHYGEARYVLHDFSAIETFAYDEQALKNIVEASADASLLQSEALPAVITCNEGLRRTVEILQELTPRPICLFDSLEQARYWAQSRVQETAPTKHSPVPRDLQGGFKEVR